MKGNIRRNKILIITFLLLFFISCKSDPTAPDNDSWTEDLDYVANELPQKHINLFTKISSENFISEIASLKTKIDTLKDYEIYFSLLKIIASIGDAHTNIRPIDLSEFYLFPFSGYWFSDGFYVVSASQEYQNILGKKIIGIGNHSIDQVYDLIKPFIPHENDAQLLNEFPEYVISAELLYFINVIGDLHSANFYFEEIGEISMSSYEYETYSNTTFINLLQSLEVDLPLYLQNNSNYWYTYIPDQLTLYFQYNLCKDNYEQSFVSFSQDLFSFINKNSIEKLVLDVRNNPGGSSIILKPFINQISQIDSLNKLGHLFTIVGRRTFSSAILNTLEIQISTNSLFYGEATGGKPNHFGEVKTFTLPNHNYVVSYSTKYFTYSNSNNPSFYPDYNIELLFEDYINGTDPVLNEIINY